MAMSTRDFQAVATSPDARGGGRRLGFGSKRVFNVIPGTKQAIIDRNTGVKPPAPPDPETPPIEGHQAGPEEAAQAAAQPPPAPVSTPVSTLPVAGTFSRPGAGKAEVVRRARFGGNPFSNPDRQVLDRSVQAAFATQGPGRRFLSDDERRRTVLSQALRG